MAKICFKCNHIGKENHSTYISVVAPIFLIFLSASFLFDLGVFATPQLGLLAPLVWLVFGIYTLKIFIDKPDACPNCKNKRTMIPLDTPRAQKLIKEHNLTVPTSTLPETTPNPK